MNDDMPTVQRRAADALGRMKGTQGRFLVVSQRLEAASSSQDLPATLSALSDLSDILREIGDAAVRASILYGLVVDLAEEEDPS